MDALASFLILQALDRDFVQDLGFAWVRLCLDVFASFVILRPWPSFCGVFDFARVWF